MHALLLSCILPVQPQSTRCTEAKAGTAHGRAALEHLARPARNPSPPHPFLPNLFCASCPLSSTSFHLPSPYHVRRPPPLSPAPPTHPDNMNKQIAGTPLEGKSLEEIVLASWNGGSPTPVFNNAAQVNCCWFHIFQFAVLSILGRHRFPGVPHHTATSHTSILPSYPPLPDIRCGTTPSSGRA